MSTEYKHTLPDAKCPLFFDLIGGTRVFLVRGGPGVRSSKERTDGKCDLSFKRGDYSDAKRTEHVQTVIAEEIEKIITTNNKFDGAIINTVPTVYHDGQPKSIDSYDIFREMTSIAYTDGMSDVKDDEKIDANYFWNHGINRTDSKTITSIIVFAGMKTILQVLKASGCFSRITCAAGGIIPVMVPISGNMSVALGMGPYAHSALRWGSVTKDEYDMANTNVTSLKRDRVVDKKEDVVSHPCTGANKARKVESSNKGAYTKCSYQ